MVSSMSGPSSTRTHLGQPRSRWLMMSSWEWELPQLMVVWQWYCRHTLMILGYLQWRAYSTRVLPQYRNVLCETVYACIYSSTIAYAGSCYVLSSLSLLLPSLSLPPPPSPLPQLLPFSFSVSSSFSPSLPFPLPLHLPLLLFLLLLSLSSSPSSFPSQVLTPRLG